MDSSGFKIYEDMFYRFANSWGEYQLLTDLLPQKEQFAFYQSLRHAKSTHFEANEGQYDGSEKETDLGSAANIATCDCPYWRSTTYSDTFVDSGKGFYTNFMTDVKRPIFVLSVWKVLSCLK